MDNPSTDKIRYIHADMKVLDIVSHYRQTLDVFKRYDEPASECICCELV
jgi:hypothetical protein